jgi:hypothetical protein
MNGLVTQPLKGEEDEICQSMFLLNLPHDTATLTPTLSRQGRGKDGLASTNVFEVSEKAQKWHKLFRFSLWNFRL